jgi:hypothetical protein
MYNIKVYIGCSLTYAPEDFKKNVESLKKKLTKDCHLLHFKGLSDQNIPRDVYIHDIVNNVRQSDLLVAICDYPSTGLGYEIAVQAEDRKMPVLAVAHKDSLVSKLIIDPKVSDYDFYRYEDILGDLYLKIIETIKKHSKEK